MPRFVWVKGARDPDHDNIVPWEIEGKFTTGLARREGINDEAEGS